MVTAKEDEMTTTTTMEMWTVWQFRSVDGKQVARVIRRSEPMEQRFQHEYQKIVYRGTDYQQAKAHAA